MPEGWESRLPVLKEMFRLEKDLEESLWFLRGIWFLEVIKY